MTNLETEPGFQHYKLLADQVEQLIESTHEYPKNNDSAGASEFLWDTSDSDLKTVLALRGMNALPGAGTYTIFEGNSLVGSIIHLPESQRNALISSTPDSRLKGKDIQAMIDLIEEVSHFKYIHFYFEKFGEKPHSAMTELIAVLDKYNVMQGLYQKHYRRAVDKKTYQLIVNSNLLSYDEKFKGSSTGNYIVGHRLGKAYIDYLNGVYEEGGDVDRELSEFFNKSSEEQFRYLLYTLRLDFETFSKFEEDEVLKVASELGVRVFRRD